MSSEQQQLFSFGAQKSARPAAPARPQAQPTQPTQPAQPTQAAARTARTGDAMPFAVGIITLVIAGCAVTLFTTRRRHG